MTTTGSGRPFVAPKIFFKLPNLTSTSLSEIDIRSVSIGVPTTVSRTIGNPFDIPTMKFYAAVVALSAVLAGTEVSAFSPRNFISNKSGLMVPSTGTSMEQQQQSSLWIPPMKMVAGGAERAYGQEYYEGAFG
jgi:hypothetical protein